MMVAESDSGSMKASGVAFVLTLALSLAFGRILVFVMLSVKERSRLIIFRNSRKTLPSNQEQSGAGSHKANVCFLLCVWEFDNVVPGEKKVE